MSLETYNIPIGSLMRFGCEETTITSLGLWLNLVSWISSWPVDWKKFSKWHFEFFLQGYPVRNKMWLQSSRMTLKLIQSNKTEGEPCNAIILLNEDELKFNSRNFFKFWVTLHSVLAQCTWLVMYYKQDLTIILSRVFTLVEPVQFLMYRPHTRLFDVLPWILLNKTNAYANEIKERYYDILI